MPHISQKPLSEEEFKRIYKEFIRSVSRFKDQKSFEQFFWEFLTPTEKVMLAKRLAVIVLLNKGLSSYEIWKFLNVSPSTIERLGVKLDRNGYKHIVKTLSDKKVKFIKFVEALVFILEPPPYHASKKKYLEYKRRMDRFLS